jgi:hypothetical protein
MSLSLRVLSGAALISGKWLGSEDELVSVCQADAASVDLSSLPMMPGRRLPRADRLTQLAARTVTSLLPSIREEVTDPTELGLAGASVLSSLQSNEQFESRRVRTGRGAPRVFPYTASNAWLGELAIALQARGPNLNLVGSHEVGLQALRHAARWLSNARCGHVLVVAAESPPPSTQLIPPRWEPIEAAVALLVTSCRHERGVKVQLQRSGASPASNPGQRDDIDSKLLSVGPLARLLQATWSQQGRVDVPTPGGGVLTALVRS